MILIKAMTVIKCPCTFKLVVLVAVKGQAGVTYFGCCAL